jgi:MFS family permease
MVSAWGAGALAGSAAYARWSRRSARALIALSAAALGAGFVVIAVAPWLWLALIGSALGGAGNAVEWVAARTLVQERTPERWMALVLSFNDSLSQLTPGIGIMLGGVITELTTSRVAFAIAGGGSLVFAAVVVVLLAPSRMGPLYAEEPAPSSGPGGVSSSARSSLV